MEPAFARIFGDRGAMRLRFANCGVGWEAALIKRIAIDVPGVGPQPRIVGNDLSDVADQLIARQRDHR